MPAQQAAPEHVPPSLIHLAKQLDEPGPQPGNQVQLLRQGETVFETLEAALDQARHHVHLVYYIWEPDRTGARLRDALARALQEERGGALIPPYDHPDVIAGQGTATLELHRQVGPLDMLLVKPFALLGIKTGPAFPDLFQLKFLNQFLQGEHFPSGIVRRVQDQRRSD